MDTDYLPSTGFVRIVFGVLVAGILFYVIYSGAPEIRAVISGFFQQGSAGSAEKNEDAYSDYRTLDTDKDGLFDWEESLFGTDHTLADTDSDGTTDFEEYHAVSVALANDSLAGTIPLGQQIGGVLAVDAFDPNNLTDSLARDLYTSLSIAKQQSGGVLKESDTEQLATIAAKTTQGFSIRQYEDVDFKTVPDSSLARTNFVNDFAKIQQQSPLRPDDLRRVLLAIENDSSIPADIIERSAQYNKFVTQHLSVLIPTTKLPAYKNYVNALNRYLEMVRLIALNDIDPARSIGAIQSMENVVQNLDRYIQQFALSFKS